jgi:alkanesulfonate monooxygenase SsuD/methylene tetrahydromethanopterin reductase-like flavin-dependent oxidoreductase (luciferase family)
VGAAHADVYLTWGEPPPAVTEQIARLQAVQQASQSEGQRRMTALIAVLPCPCRGKLPMARSPAGSTMSSAHQAPDPSLREMSPTHVTQGI